MDYYIGSLLAALPETLRIIVILILFIILIMWLFLPIAIVQLHRKVIRIEGHNRQLVEELKETNRLLYKLTNKPDAS